MICNYDMECRVWIAAGNGPLRPILVEAGTRQDAIHGYTEEHADQIAEEKRFAREYEEGERQTALAMHLERKGEDYKAMMREAHAYKGAF